MPRHIVFDVETTGLSPLNGARIIEIGTVVIENKLIIREFHSRVNAGVSISKSAQQVNGITSRMLHGAPRPEDIMPEFCTLISGAILVAHNARFDIDFLRHEFGRLWEKLNNNYECTLQLSRKLLPRSLSDLGDRHEEVEERGQILTKLRRIVFSTHSQIARTTVPCGRILTIHAR